MFSYLCQILLSSGVLIVSDSANIGNMDKLSLNTQFFWDPAFDHGDIDKQSLKDKNILLVVHGYNNTFDYAIKSIDEVNSSIGKMKNTQGSPLYDLVIGYVWPGYDNFIEYGLAVEHADALKSRVRKHLIDLNQVSAKVDILAHSLGNRVMLEALNFCDSALPSPLIRNFFAMAPAVDATAIQKNGTLTQAVSNCKNLFVLHSNKDDVLKLLYPLTSGKEALGIESSPNFKKLPDNIQFVDCSKLVNGHGYYFKTKAIFRFVENLDNGINPLPNKTKKVSLLKDGKVKSIKS